MAWAMALRLFVEKVALLVSPGTAGADFLVPGVPCTSCRPQGKESRPRKATEVGREAGKQGREEFSLLRLGGYRGACQATAKLEWKGGKARDRR
ncbi:hypothetical protein B0I35DRAFT_428493 [Stachybotrys elegans]|uniref:Secreted protein n=1 Tax=Stachybotrys elegans TaxID=80388 RepID=A0A8K0SYE7_9HYPO|nr:hypothetical protein B0I35DRAFT_428493 [Stachybotrys elegans]